LYWDRIVSSLSFSWIAASRWAIAASRSAESELHSADNAASLDDSAITVCRSNAGSEGKSLMQSDSTTTPLE
jgi:hypothetical protein